MQGSNDQAIAEEVDRRLRDVADRTSRTFMDMARVAAEAVDIKVWERFGYVSVDLYFQERIGVAYRTLKRWLQADAGPERLPAEERGEARAKLAKLGVHKAASLGPVFGRPGVDWREQVAFAEQATSAAVQARATDITGNPPRGISQAPGASFLRYIVNQVPSSESDHVAAVFAALMKFADLKHPMAAFLMMVAFTEDELGHHGIEVKE
jgi:hypothetical protein